MTLCDDNVSNNSIRLGVVTGILEIMTLLTVQFDHFTLLMNDRLKHDQSCPVFVP